MADNQKKYRHISVDDDDDDVVIYAGARRKHASTDEQPADVLRRQAKSSSKKDASHRSKDNHSVEDAQHHRSGNNHSEEDVAHRGEHDLSDAEKEDIAFERAMAKRKLDRQKNHMVTTEEDLHRPVPFAGMRIAIFVIGIVIVAGIIFYYAQGAQGFSLL